MIMPCQNLFRTIRVGSLIGIALALSHLMESSPRNYVAICVNVVLFFFLFGINHGFERWLTLVMVATSVYFGCMYAEDLVGGPLVGRVNEASTSALRRLFDMYADQPAIHQHQFPPSQYKKPLTHREEMSLLKRLWKTKAAGVGVDLGRLMDSIGREGVRARDAVRVISGPATGRSQKRWRWSL